MSSKPISVERIDLAQLDQIADSLEAVLEGFDRPDIALENLEEAPIEESRWAMRVTLDGTTLHLVADRCRWGLYATPEVDPADAMATARKLHGILGEPPEDWDADR